jgi:hypothetical protein
MLSQNALHSPQAFPQDTMWNRARMHQGPIYRSNRIESNEIDWGCKWILIYYRSIDRTQSIRLMGYNWTLSTDSIESNLETDSIESNLETDSIGSNRISKPIRWIGYKWDTSDPIGIESNRIESNLGFGSESESESEFESESIRFDERESTVMMLVGIICLPACS